MIVSAFGKWGDFFDQHTIGNRNRKRAIKSTVSLHRPCFGEGGYLVLAEQDDEIVGFLWTFKRKISAPIEQDELFINAIEVISEALRCQGIASRMVERIQEIATEEKVYQLRVYCDIRNVPSHRLWVKNRFSISPVPMPDDTFVGSYVSLVI